MVRFTRVGGLDARAILVKNVEGDIGVISPQLTGWYTGDRLRGTDDNQGVIQFPLVVFVAQGEEQISDALKRHCRDLEEFGQRLRLLRANEGTLYVVLMDSERRGTTLNMTMAFGFTPNELIPDFSGVELDTIFTVDTPITPANKVSRYERKWVI